MKVLFCGGAGEVGASCVLVCINGKNIVFDAGIRIGAPGGQLPDMRLLQENGGVDAVVISHAHMDHGGSLPVLCREYPNAPVYMTHATKDLLRVLLYDSLKIMETREAEIPAFAEVHVRNALDRAVCYSPNQTFRPFLSSPDIAVTFFGAGHIAGAVSAYVTSGEGAVFYSGDFSPARQRTVEGASIPRLRPDLAVFESTYGNRLHADRNIEENRLIDMIRDVTGAGKKVLIPAFALGRAQEIILVLKRAMNKKQIPLVKIFVDGMVNDICRVYRQNPRYLQSSLGKKAIRENEIFYDEQIIPVAGKIPQEKQRMREEIAAMKEGCCIIASSGMLTGGPSQWYATKLAPEEGHFIALTGYQDEESPGSQLLTLADAAEGEERFLKLGELSISVRCGIGKFGLSAHADKMEIISLVHALGARSVFLVHGNADVSASLAGELQKEYGGRNVYAPVNGEVYAFDVKSPRRQAVRRELATLGRVRALSAEDMEELWSFVHGKYTHMVGFTAEDLLYIWKGNVEEGEAEDLYGLLGDTAFFEPEMRRPFIFHAVTPETLAEKNADQTMEVNRMLALADTYFPSAAGLYKKGARFEEKAAVLYFNFPDVAKRKYEELFDAFARETGWRVTVNTEANLSAAQNLVYDLFAEITGTADGIEKVSYYPAENLFRVRVGKQGPHKKAVEERFEQETGMRLSVETAGGNTPKPVIRAQTYQAEQNEAFAAIQKAFEGMPDKLYKKSLKMADGQSCIELSFISPAVAKKYMELISELEGRLRWPIRINPVPNQNELLNVARRLLSQNGISIKKNPAFMPKENEVIIQPEPVEEEKLQNAASEFQRLTGLQMGWK